MGEDTGMFRPCEGHGPLTRACVRPCENRCRFEIKQNSTWARDMDWCNHMACPHGRVPSSSKVKYSNVSYPVSLSDTGKGCYTTSDSDFQIESDNCLMFRGRICVPKNSKLIQKILHEAHSGCLSVHLGSTKMYNDLNQLYCSST
ncbi:integrase [Gossypium australe]|uniref:Integrase n=1 Tax=Gossypium australe TaxID=47621 RepID=A0A5B6X2H5_9ROSI|nr:integrase [Gossypium australe]